MDLDAYVVTHRHEWDRLEWLVGRRRALDAAEADELVWLYQRVATDLSVVRSAAPDPVLVGRLSSLVARARAAVVGAGTPAWGEVATFFTRTFPAALYRLRGWWLGAAAGFLLLSLLTGLWAGNPAVQARLATPEQIRAMVASDFADYYSSHPASSFAAQVWTNNAWVTALCLVSGILLGLPVLYLLANNALNVGVVGAIMVTHDRAGVFFGLILPHGMLELTAVFVAAGAGLRFGWAIIEAGPLPRGQAVAEQGRRIGVFALGLASVLLVSGLIEAFVTPSGLPTWARIGIGLAAEAAFLGYALVLGRAAAARGVTGDVFGEAAADVAPLAA